MGKLKRKPPISLGVQKMKDAPANKPFKNNEENTESIPSNVLNYSVNQEPTPIKAFTDEGDEFAGKTHEELLEELGKTNVDIEETKGVVVEDAITGERIPGNANDIHPINSLQELEPENIKHYLSNIIKQSLSFLIPDELSDEKSDEIINTLEQKIADLDKKDIKNLSPNEIKNIYGEEIFNQIKKYHPVEYVKLAKKLLVDFKDGMIEYQSVVDVVEEINRHTKFFKDLNLDQVQKDLFKQVEEDNETYPTEFHKYKKYLELYLEYLKGKEEYNGNPFMQKEIETAEYKIQAIEEALDFRHIFNKCQTSRQKILKDFKDPKILNKGIFDFIGKLNNDNSMNIAFPIPKNFSLKANASEVLTSVWISFLEMAIMRGKFENIKSLTPSEYTELALILRGKESEKKNNKEENNEVDDNNSIDINEFIKENNITLEELVESRQAAIAISYIIARTFKPSVISNSNHMKYVLSYTMNLLTQSFHNENCNKLLMYLVEGVRIRLAG